MSRFGTIIKGQLRTGDSPSSNIEFNMGGGWTEAPFALGPRSTRQYDVRPYSMRRSDKLGANTREYPNWDVAPWGGGVILIDAQEAETARLWREYYAWEQHHV
jgi:hypothetical protein